MSAKIHRRQDRNKIFGVILVGLGIIFLVEILFGSNLFDFLISLWPLILIVIGWKILRDAKRSQRKHEYEDEGKSSFEEKSSKGFSKESEEDRFAHSAIIGDTSIRLTTKNFQGGNASSVIGDIHVNLSEIDFDSGERKLRFSTVIGDSNITMPKDFAFNITGSSVIGDIHIFGQKAEGLFRNLSYKSQNYDTAEKRIKIFVSSVIGDIHIA